MRPRPLRTPVNQSQRNAIFSVVSEQIVFTLVIMTFSKLSQDITVKVQPGANHGGA